MASFNNGDIDWLWGSLKPWQILHSTLAEKERCGSVQVDVWELVNETLGASTTDFASEEEEVQEGDGRRSHGIQFLGDDGDFWRHGGVIESRVREWLARKAEEDHHHHLHHHKCSSTELAIASSTIDQRAAALSIAWEAASASDFDSNDQNSCAEDDDDEGENVDHAEEEEDSDGDQDALHEEEEEELEEDEEEDSYRLISSNYNINRDYNEISREIFVVNQCCRAGVGAAGDQGARGETAKLAEGMEAPPDLEEVESIEVCAVCLEKLNQYYNEGEEEGGVQALACRHVFHTACISPWLQRQPHACCPCCRAPISTANLAPPLHLEAPLHLAVSRDHACAALHGHAGGELQQERRMISHDIMRLLADMEAALEHLGFRS